ncbi:MAG: hypothetical protein OXG85_16075 [Chloroflexi bacterium]|nr:hypothetical protein [Chloroflexota bacterium]
MTRKLTAEQLIALIGFHRSPRAAQMRGRGEIRVFTNDEDYAKWRRELLDEYLAERQRRQDDESDQQNESGANR